MNYKLFYKVLKDAIDTLPYNFNLFCSCGKHFKIEVGETENSMRVYLECKTCQEMYFLVEKDKRLYGYSQGWNPEEIY
jgi:hypothetical protein